jgi:hypothetical protein
MTLSGRSAIREHEQNVRFVISCRTSVRPIPRASFASSSKARQTAGEPTGPGMPSFAWKLSDDPAAAVLTYIRNSWGAAAPAVDPRQANKLARAAMASTGR